MSMRQLKISKSITNRESQSLEKYLQEIGRVELIKPEEEEELARRIKLGDLKALDRLTKANLRFVVSVAKQYQNQGLTLSDLINEEDFIDFWQFDDEFSTVGSTKNDLKNKPSNKDIKNRYLSLIRKLARSFWRIRSHSSKHFV
jgi:hypothetical protein